MSMCYVMMRDVEEKLHALKYPYAFAYGPEYADQRDYKGRIVFERDREDEDGAPIAPRARTENPKMVYMRPQAVQIRVYAQSSLPGARVEDHERECDRVIDALLVAMFEWEKEAGAMYQWSSMGYMSKEERDDVKVWPGVVYSIRLSVFRSVNKFTYTAEEQALSKRPEGAATGVSNSTSVTLRGAEGETPEAACGA